MQPGGVMGIDKMQHFLYKNDGNCESGVNAGDGGGDLGLVPGLVVHGGDGVLSLRAWSIWDNKMRSRHSKRGLSTSKVGLTGWTGVVLVSTAVMFLVLASSLSLLRSSLVSWQESDLACSSRRAARDETQRISFSLSRLPLANNNSVDDSLSNSGNNSVNNSDENSPPIFSPPVQKLLDELKEARHLAESDGDQQVYTQEEKENWEREHPCRARTELPPLYASRQVVDAPPNPQWAAVFEEYSHLHRACMRKVGNSIIDVYNEKRVIPGCKFMTGESLFGVGNKITYAASVLLYAVITKRVVLFPQSTAPLIMCEPFEGSFWKLPWDLEHLNRRVLGGNNVNLIMNSNATIDFLDWVDAANGSLDSAVADEGFFHAEADDGWHPVNRFYCDTEQNFLSKAQWLSAAGCLYFVPKLYTIPSVRNILEDLFPRPGLTLTYVLRSAFLPTDEAWDRIQRIYMMHLENSDRRVGIQARYRGGQYEYEKFRPHVNAHITKCLQENSILPNVTEFSSRRLGNRLSSPPFPIVKVLITSLYMDLHDHLNELYLRHSTVTGESVGFVQVTHENEQHYGREVDLQALVEIICLSLSDVILATPLSTFGGAAQVYGALTPWLIEFNDQEEASCVRSPSVDLCYQIDEVDTRLSCPYDLAVNGSHVLEEASYIHTCSPIESETGILLLAHDLSQ